MKEKGEESEEREERWRVTAKDYRVFFEESKLF